MTPLRTAAQQVLEACEQRLPLKGQAEIIDELNDLRAALAEPQEPVAWRYKYADGFWRFSNGERVNGCDPVERQPLYTAPP